MIDSKRARQYCTDPSKIENYDIAITDRENLWVVHHRGEILPCGRYSQATLKKFGLYWHRPPEELIFMKQGEHIKMHQTGVRFTDEHRANLSKSAIGKHCGELHPRFGVFGEYNPLYGRHWYTNGHQNTLAYECPGVGWFLGRTM